MAAFLRYCPACHSWQPFYRFFYRSTGSSRHRWHRRCHVCKHSGQPADSGPAVSLAVPTTPAGAAAPGASPASTAASPSSPIPSRPAELL